MRYEQQWDVNSTTIRFESTSQKPAKRASKIPQHLMMRIFKAGGWPMVLRAVLGAAGATEGWHRSPRVIWGDHAYSQPAMRQDV